MVVIPNRRCKQAAAWQTQCNFGSVGKDVPNGEKCKHHTRRVGQLERSSGARRSHVDFVGNPDVLEPHAAYTEISSAPTVVMPVADVFPLASSERLQSRAGSAVTMTERLPIKDAVYNELLGTATLNVGSKQLSLNASRMMCRGALIWNAGLVMAALLGNDQRLEGKRVLEVGSGTGVSGLSAALAGANVVLSDMAGNLPLLEQNIAMNSLESNAVAVELVWGSTSELPGHGQFDLIIGSDVLAYRKLSDSLLETLVAMSTPGKTEVFLTYAFRNVEDKFFASAETYFEVLEKYPLQDATLGKIWCVRLRCKQFGG